LSYLRNVNKKGVNFIANILEVKIKWCFICEDAGVKLLKLYPSIQA